jgi:hypothetical protein
MSDLYGKFRKFRNLPSDNSRIHASETTKMKKKSELIEIYMGSFENFETYHPIAIPDPRFHASETTKQKGKLEQNLRNFRNIPIIPILDW